ncbi:MAG: fibronectin type III domain-containing protein [Lachnospiraceae bacterium]|nr:fibronectin type III domain-containing protein [Lachnospiraceae bacterium]
MRRINLRKSITAFALAAVMAAGIVPAAPASADTVKVSEVTGLGVLPAAPAAPTIALKDSVVSGQTTRSWTFNYSNVPEDVKYMYPAYKSYNYTDENDASGKTTWKVTEKDNPESADPADISSYSYTMRVLIFNAGDRTKPEGGSMSKDSAGKYVIKGSYTTASHVDLVAYPYSTLEFTVEASDLTPGNKEVVAYYFNKPAYDFAYDEAQRADYKAYCEAYVAWRNAYEAAKDAWKAAGSNGTAPQLDWSEAPSENDYKANRRAVSEADYYVASAPVAITVDSEASIDTIVTSTSVKLSFGSTGGATGYEVYRKVGKNYVKIATVSSATYTDSGLLSKTTYTYRVRPYYVNSTNNTITYGKYRFVDATTKGSAFNLKATVTSKNKIKLTWKKVSGATGYEIYRSNTASDPSSVSKGIYNGFDTFKKVKTLKKSKKSWTDSTVKANEGYSYIVRAIMPKNKNTKSDSNLIIEGSVGASLRFGSISTNEDYTDAKGNRTITWNKVYGANGYKVEEYTYDTTKGFWDWTPVVNLGKNATSYKFVAGIYSYYKDAEAQAKGEISYSTQRRYRITPYKSETVLGTASIFNTYYYEGMVQKVNAKKEASGIRITWTPVSGAAYYEVYRTKSRSRINDKDIGGYNSNGTPITEYVDASAPVTVDVAAWNAAVDTSYAEYKTIYAQQKAAYDAEYNKQVKAYDDACSAYNGSGAYPKRDDYVKVKEKDFITVKASDYLDKYDKLDAVDGSGNPKVYYYQNYSYARSLFTDQDASKGVLDYYGDDIYSGTMHVTKNDETTALGADGRVNVAFDYTADPVVEADNAIKLGENGRPQAGVTYDYYVVAHMDTAKAVTDYKEYYGYTWDAITNSYVPSNTSYRVADETAWSGYTTKTAPISDASIITYQTTRSAYNKAVTGPQAKSTAYATAIPYISTKQYKGISTASSYEGNRNVTVGGIHTSTLGVKTYGTATYTSKAAAKKPTLKSVKATKGKVTITIKKKVAGADYYKVYRATKKKGKYHSVGVTSSAKTTKFVDKSAVKGKTYYYKVVSVVKNEANGELESAASAIKKVKAK